MTELEHTIKCFPCYLYFQGQLFSYILLPCLILREAIDCNCAYFGWEQMVLILQYFPILCDYRFLMLISQDSAMWDLIES